MEDRYYNLVSNDEPGYNCCNTGLVFLGTDMDTISQQPLGQYLPVQVTLDNTQAIDGHHTPPALLLVGGAYPDPAGNQVIFRMRNDGLEPTPDVDRTFQASLNFSPDQVPDNGASVQWRLEQEPGPDGTAIKVLYGFRP